MLGGIFAVTAGVDERAKVGDRDALLRRRVPESHLCLRNGRAEGDREQRCDETRGGGPTQRLARTVMPSKRAG
jgi:hypothetical protein